MSMPMSLAACQIVVPSGTVTSWPSIVRLTVRISVGAGVEIATVTSSSPRLDRGKYLRTGLHPMGSQDEYPQPQILHLLAGWYTTYIESTDLVVPRDHVVQPLARERRGAAGLHLERLGQEALRQPVVGARPALAGVERALGEDDPPRRRLQLRRVDVPAAHGAQEARPLGVGLLEDAAQELAEDQRVHDRGAVLGLDRGRDVRLAAREAVEAPGHVGLVGARAVVVRAAGDDREDERHRLQRARLVAGELHALDVRRERVRALPDLLRRRARALGEQRAGPRARADLGAPPPPRGPPPSDAPREPSASSAPMPSRAPISSITRSSASASPKRSHGASIRPRSTHSIAHAIGPPAEMLPSPSSSQRPLAASTASGSETPHSGPRAKTFSYSTRTPLPPAPL